MNFKYLLTCLIGLGALLAYGQAPIVASDEGARMHEVTKGVYCIIHDDATDEWPHGNTGVVVGEKSVLVIDATYLPSRASADIAFIRKVTDKPVAFLAYTHWHFDHNNGAISYVKAFPGIQVISERNTKEYTELNGIYWSKMSAAPQSFKRKILSDLETSLTTGKDAKGNTISDSERINITRRIEQRKGELKELETLEVVTPSRVFDKELTLDLGKRKVILRDWGAANSPNDVTFYLPSEKILFTGDILVQSPLPYSLNSNPVPWVAVLKQVENIPITSLVPGHGPVMVDHSYTKQVRSLLETLVDRVRESLRQGKTLQEIQSSVTMEDHYKGVWGQGTEESKSDWKATVNSLIERTSRNLRGQ